MSIFGNILSKLGIGNHQKKPDTTTQQTAPSAAPTSTTAPTSSPASTTNAIEPVDVVAKLESLSTASAEKLNWKTSIVDLLKLLGLDSSLNSRKELATELGCPAEKMADSAQMNMWLHKQVLKKLAENGGNIPPELHK